MAKRPRRKATLRSAGKVTEADLLERARALAEDPSLATPICDGPCVLFSPVKAARKAIPKVFLAKDDEARLQRYANGGNDLVRAYAATLLVARAEKIPYVAELRLPTGTIPYVIRGKAKPFFLAGLQNHHDRASRLVSYFPWAKKRRIYFFSADRGVVCTGRSPKPPADFVEEEMDELDLARKPGAATAYACEHGGAGPGRDALVLRWKAAGVSLERCASCLEAEGSTLVTLLKHMVGPGLFKQFDVEVHLSPLSSAAGAVAVVPTLPEALRLSYLQGRASDRAVLEGGRDARMQELRAKGARLYVAGERSFGEDADAFLQALAPGAAEERALRAALARHEGPVVLDRASVARAVAELWPQHGLAMLEAAAGDAETAKRLHKEKPAPDEAAELVRRAGREGAARNALADLPRYARLPPVASVADAIARAHRTQGAEAALRVAQERANAGKGKGVALAFLQALGGGKGQEWRFSQSDQETAVALAPVVKDLLAATGERYHDALREASRLSGENADFTPQR